MVVANVPDEGTALLVVDREAEGVTEGELGASIGRQHALAVHVRLSCGTGIAVCWEQSAMACLGRCRTSIGCGWVSPPTASGGRAGSLGRR